MGRMRKEVEPGAPDDGPADLDFLPHPAHVWTGPLARAPVVHEPDKAGRSRLSSAVWSLTHMWRRARVG
jgi:hypothetical protein